MTAPNAQMLRGRRLCAFTARQDGEDPVPSAVRWDRCLAIEVDTPWNKEIANSAAFPPGVAHAAARYEAQGSSLRIQGLVRDNQYSVPGRTRVLDARLAPQQGRYQAAEYLAPTQETGALVAQLLNGGAPNARLQSYRADLSGVRDILVCTHGSRDACCARFGYQVYRRLRDEFAHASGGSLRVWRTSHTGGHRFAPTLIDLPEGRYWAWIGPDRIDPFMSRQDPAESMIDCYRGLAALATPYEQVAEREAFRREGWPWTSFDISGRIVDFDQADAVANVRIDFRSPTGERSGSYAAAVRRLQDIVTEGCASAQPGKTVTADQYQVHSFAPLH